MSTTTETTKQQNVRQPSDRISDRQPFIQKIDPVSTPSISWPILLAIIPAFGTFVAGSADIWSDFVMLLLILYYVYKWMTGK
jgi:hypothetical protein